MTLVQFSKPRVKAWDTHFSCSGMRMNTSKQPMMYHIRSLSGDDGCEGDFCSELLELTRSPVTDPWAVCYYARRLALNVGNVCDVC